VRELLDSKLNDYKVDFTRTSDGSKYGVMVYLLLFKRVRH
jgi:hypothetical protein